uniref:Uncharacterized protein n=1 Tax=Octopus bimaculoides TaxID=37653 RepID=A0A0L8IC31_OCTBM
MSLNKPYSGTFSARWTTQPEENSNWAPPAISCAVYLDMRSQHRAHMVEMHVPGVLLSDW